jgi:secretion/DNA translocation related TadE-like protein
MADQRGAATVLTTAMAGVLLLVGAAAMVVGAMVVAHRRAQAAADLAALAGAGSLADPSGRSGGGRDPCVVAGEIAAANRARLRSCHVVAADVVVEVSVAGPRWLGQVHDLTAAARAGPG